MKRILQAHICLAAVASVAVDFSVFGGDLAPPSPDKPWYPPQLHEYEKKLAHREVGESPSGTPIAIDPEKVYDLPELIDIAERTNPETRIAWERARLAAAAVGLSQSAYFPIARHHASLAASIKLSVAVERNFLQYAIPIARGGGAG